MTNTAPLLRPEINATRDDARQKAIDLFTRGFEAGDASALYKVHGVGNVDFVGVWMHRKGIEVVDGR